MPTRVSATKVQVPPRRLRLVRRPRLIDRLDTGRHGRLTLISAPAGSGKTTLIGEWAAGAGGRVAWLSLEADDGDPTRFLICLVAALQTVVPGLGEGLAGVLQSPQPPPPEPTLAALLDQVAALSDPLVLVLDDYQAIDAPSVDALLAALVRLLPAQLHLVIATRRNPRLSLARLRARGQLTELSAADLRFRPDEAAEFLREVMGLDIEAGDIALLEARTEGWIAGLQLAALSMQGQADVAGFVRAFTGRHRSVLDFLVEEVLHLQPEKIQGFLLRTSILDRLCGPLCDAVLAGDAARDTPGQETLELLERANLFVVPLDGERRWYRYHQLFSDLLRQRLLQDGGPPDGNDGGEVARLHLRACEWYEAQGLDVDALHHAAAAGAVDRAQRLVEGGRMPLHFRGALAPVLSWLGSLAPAVLECRPALQVTYATAMAMAGRPLAEVEVRLEEAEAALRASEPDGRTRDLLGQIASIRAMQAIPRPQVEVLLAQSLRALELLSPDNLPSRASATWTLGFAHQLGGEWAPAGRAFAEAIAASQATGNTMITIAAMTCLGQVQEADGHLHLAAETYGGVVELAGDPALPAACEAHLGLARLLYQWNDLAASEHHGRLGERLAGQMVNIDTPIACGVLLGRITLARGDAVGAMALLAAAERFARRRGFSRWMPEIAGVRVQALLARGNPAAAAALAEAHPLSLSRARVHLARGDPAAARAALDSLERRPDHGAGEVDRLALTVLRALVHRAGGERDEALRVLGEALLRGEAEGRRRVFLDEGPPVARLLAEARARGVMADWVGTLLAAFEAEAARSQPAQPLVEALSRRELEVLALIGQGRSNQEIGERLFLALDTVKGHNRRIFEKLQVQRRTEAVARARELGLL
jgi:LuxR family maltose regulon positive regulatory protein